MRSAVCELCETGEQSGIATRNDDEYVLNVGSTPKFPDLIADIS